MSNDSLHPRLAGRASVRRAPVAERLRNAVSAAMVAALALAFALWPDPSDAARIEGGSAYFGRVLSGGRFVEGSDLATVYGTAVTVTITDFRPPLVFAAEGMRCTPPREGFCFTVLIHAPTGDLVDRIDGVSASGQTVTGGLPDAILIEDPDFAGFGMVIVLPGRPDPMTGENGTHALHLQDIPFGHADANALIIASHVAGEVNGTQPAPVDTLPGWADRFVPEGLGW